MKSRQGLLQTNKAKKIRNHSCLYKFCNYKSYDDFATSKQFEELGNLVGEAKVQLDADSVETRELLLLLY